MIPKIMLKSVQIIAQLIYIHLFCSSNILIFTEPNKFFSLVADDYKFRVNRQKKKKHQQSIYFHKIYILAKYPTFFEPKNSPHFTIKFLIQFNKFLFTLFQRKIDKDLSPMDENIFGNFQHWFLKIGAGRRFLKIWLDEKVSGLVKIISNMTPRRARTDALLGTLTHTQLLIILLSWFLVICSSNYLLTLAIK